MKIIDISWPIDLNMTQYKNRQDVGMLATKTFKQHNVRDTLVTLGTHTGTHVDAPAHFLEDGITINEIPLNNLCGTAHVFDFTHVQDCITVEDLKAQNIEPDTIVLLKTRNSIAAWDALFNTEFVYVDAVAAKYLVDKKIKAVGIDYLGIESNQPGHPTHKVLLSNNIPIIEGLRLEHAQPGNYTLICLPLALKGLDAAPARAILLEPKLF